MVRLDNLIIMYGIIFLITRQNNTGAMSVSCIIIVSPGHRDIGVHSNELHIVNHLEICSCLLSIIGIILNQCQQQEITQVGLT